MECLEWHLVFLPVQIIKSKIDSPSVKILLSESYSKLSSFLPYDHFFNPTFSDRHDECHLTIEDLRSEVITLNIP